MTTPDGVPPAGSRRAAKRKAAAMAAMDEGKDPRVERLGISPAGWPEDVRGSLTAAKGSIDTVIKHWDRLEDGERKAFVLLAAGAMAELAKKLSSAAESRDLV